MRPWIRRFVVILTALVFAAGGFGREALAIPPSEPCHNHHQDEDGHGMHHQHGVDAAPQHHQGKPGAPTDDACFKCCGICTAAPNLTDARAPTVAIFVAFSISYFAATQGYSDRPLVIDPGIPKRIA
jgi:hypothetical protein